MMNKKWNYNLKKISINKLITKTNNSCKMKNKSMSMTEASRKMNNSKDKVTGIKKIKMKLRESLRESKKMLKM